jgi:V/A-type H+-transporting ATPase subunit E
MSLKDIENKILSDAQAEADAIAKENAGLIKAKIEQKDRELKEEIERIKTAAKKQAARLKDQGAFRIRMIEKNAVLSAKQNAVDRVFDLAGKEIRELSAEEFTSFYTEALKAAPVLDDAEVICQKEKTKEIGSALKTAGLSYKIADKELAAGRQGLIISSPDIDVDLTANKFGQRGK